MSCISVLLIEDNEDHAELIAEIMCGAGTVLIEHCNSGQAALDRLEFARDGYGRRPDLVLIDINLPGIDGLTVLRRIKDDPDLRDIPAVILSTSRAAVDLGRAMAANANSYVCKSADFDVFTQRLKILRQYWTLVHAA